MLPKIRRGQRRQEGGAVMQYPKAIGSNSQSFGLRIQQVVVYWSAISVWCTRWLDTGLQRSAASYPGFPVVWRGVAVSEWWSSTGCCWPLGASRINGTARVRDRMVRVKGLWQRIDSFMSGACGNLVRLWFADLDLSVRFLSFFLFLIFGGELSWVIMISDIWLSTMRWMIGRLPSRGWYWLYSVTRRRYFVAGSWFQLELCNTILGLYTEGYWPEVCLWWSNCVHLCLCIALLQDAEMSGACDQRGVEINNVGSAE